MQSAELQIFCCRVADIDAALLDRYRAQLNDDELNRYEKFRSIPAQQEFLISRALLRAVLTQRLNCDYDRLPMRRGDDGKPLLAAPFDRWHFSLSHSRAWVVLALSQTGPVGIDVESHERGNDLAAIARRFFSAAENNSLTALDGQAWLQQFFAIWTLKEAHGKALGTGLSKILSCSSFIVDHTTQRIELQLSAVAASAGAVNCWLYRLAADTSLAVSQLGARPTANALYRCVPLAENSAPEIYSKTYLGAIASGNWAPTMLPCT